MRWTLICGRLMLSAAAALSSGPASAAKAKPIPDEVAARRSDLGDLRQRIEQMKRDVAAGETSRAEAADQLRDSERAISNLQRELHELGERHAEVSNTLRRLGGETQALESELAGQLARLERLLVRQYASGAPDPLRLVLSGADPNQIARDLHYLTLVARARAASLRETEALLGRKRELATKTSTEIDALAALESDQRRRHAEVARERDGRKLLLARLADRIKAQRKEIGALERDEQRLARLVERLNKLIAARAASKPARRPEASKPQEVTKRKNEEPVESSGTPEPGARGAFAALRGKLRLPVAGAVTGRFGAARDGGGTWKGVFIRAATGGAVKAVAPGQVVFADWMRGFGNLLILDHGDGYLSIYGFNDSLLRGVGDDVKSGDTIASVGNSGGHEESGLYFEIRYQGRAQDPLRWADMR